jgi:sulfate permease, SulP family
VIPEASVPAAVEPRALPGTDIASPPWRRGMLVGDRIHVLELQGFVFFGTANELLERIRTRTRDDGMPPLRALILDFRRVSGVDTSAVLGFRKAEQLAGTEGFDLLLSGVRPPVRRQFERGGLGGADGLRYHPDLDRALQWCEERLLEEFGPPAGERQPFWRRFGAAFGERDAGRLAATWRPGRSRRERS